MRLGSNYRFSGALSGLNIGGNFSWMSKGFWSYRSPTGEIPMYGGYMTLDLFVGYKLNEHLSAQVNVNNVFDKSYYSQSDSWSYYGSPRNASVRLKYKF